jgi:5-methylcytosine-specific restriction endonuclease McrBC regulatory subunit McrC
LKALVVYFPSINPLIRLIKPCVDQLIRQIRLEPQSIKNSEL